MMYKDPKEVFSEAFDEAIDDGFTNDEAYEVASKAMQDHIENPPDERRD